MNSYHYFAHTDSVKHIHTGDENSAAIYLGIAVIAIMISGIVLGFYLLNSRKDSHSENE